MAAEGATEASSARSTRATSTQYVEVQENLRAEIARVSGTPLHYLFITKGDYPSGEAMKSAEARFTRKVEQRQQALGNQWEDLFALAIARGLRREGRRRNFVVEWEEAAPRRLPPAACRRTARCRAGRRPVSRGSSARLLTPYGVARR